MSKRHTIMDIENLALRRAAVVAWFVGAYVVIALAGLVQAIGRSAVSIVRAFNEATDQLLAIFPIINKAGRKAWKNNNHAPQDN